MSNKNYVGFRLQELLPEIFLNPLIISVAIGILFAISEIKLPDPIEISGKLIADLALPLSLIGIGGSLELSEFKRTKFLTITASIIKIVIIPLVFTSLAYYLNFRNEDLIIIYIVSASPTAIVSFIIADTLVANRKLAGNIIVMTTIGSVIMLSIGIMILKYLSLI